RGGPARGVGSSSPFPARIRATTTPGSARYRGRTISTSPSSPLHTRRPPPMSEPLSASDLRAERARKQLPIYLLSAAVGMNPNRLGGILNERVPLTSDVA